jgi:hypothetical protein
MAPASKARIVISYRREDSEAMTGRIYDCLVEEYGPDYIYRDLESIRAGKDYREDIEEAIRGSDLLLVFIGPRWLGSEQRSRIKEDEDPVRAEIKAALAVNKPIIPVLIDDALKMPTAADLPPDIQKFSFLNAKTVDPGEDFQFHTDRLVSEIDRVTGRKRQKRVPISQNFALGSTFAILGLSCMLWYFWPKFSYWIVQNGLMKKETIVYKVDKPYRRSFYIQSPSNHQHDILFETFGESNNPDYYKGNFHDYRCQQHKPFAAEGPVERTPTDLIIRLTGPIPVFDDQCTAAGTAERQILLKWIGNWRNVWAPWYYLKK